MFSVIFALMRALAAAFQSREQLVLENLALRHLGRQVARTR